MQVQLLGESADLLVKVQTSVSKCRLFDENADLKKAEEAKAKLAESAAGLDMPDFSSMFSLGSLMAPIREKVESMFDPESAPFGLGKFTGFMRDKLLALLPQPEGMAEGGLVGLSPMNTQSLGNALGLESGGLFTLSQGEFVLDNQAAQTFLQAAMILKGQDLKSGQNLADLQMQSTQIQGGGTNVVIQNNNSSQVNQNASTVVPITPIQPSNGEQQFA